jgi:aspartate dehydrogenase
MNKLREEAIAIIGLGAIGSAVIESLHRADTAESVRVAAALVRPGRIEAAERIVSRDVRLVTSLEQLIELRPSLVLECASQEAVERCGQPILAAGIDLMVASTGALAKPGALESLAAEARKTGARLMVPAGAISGIDGLAALRLAGLVSVSYASIKPPAAWRGTAADELLDLSAVSAPTTFFEGTAREAALKFPKNANVAATIAIAGLGFDRTRVRLVADPHATANRGVLEAASAIGTLTVTMGAQPSSNPRTSASTAYSLMHALQLRVATVVV